MSRRGPLEEQVLEALWSCGAASGRTVLRRLGTGHAYTTIMTVLDRLHDKGIVQRHKERGAWIYAPCASRDELLAREVARLLVKEGHARESLLAGFLDEAETLDPAVLERLESLIRRRRRRVGEA